jgi:hypothetical protein
MIDFENKFRVIEDAINQAIDDASGISVITGDSIATATLASLDLPFPSELYSATHATLVEVARRILKERFDPAFRYGIATAAAVLEQDPDGLDEVGDAMKQEAKELEAFGRQKFGVTSFASAARKRRRS